LALENQLDMENQEYQTYKITVPSELDEVFSPFYYAKNNTDTPVTKTLFPNFQSLLIFSFGNKVTLNSNQDNEIIIDKYLYLGPVKHSFPYELDIGSEIFVINFKNDSFYRFFGGVFLEEQLLFPTTENFNNRCFTKFWKRLKLISVQEERVNFIIAFCKPYLAKRHIKSELLVNSKDFNLDPIKLVAKELKQTERSIQLHHKKYFGYSAKEVNRYNRFLKAIEKIDLYIKENKKIEWFEILDECGYYDQSHFIADFKYYIKITPSQFIKLYPTICNPVI